MAVGATVRKGCVEIVLELRQLPRGEQGGCRGGLRAGRLEEELLAMAIDPVSDSLFGLPQGHGHATDGAVGSSRGRPTSVRMQAGGSSRLLQWSGEPAGQVLGAGGGSWVEMLEGRLKTSAQGTAGGVHMRGVSPAAVRLNAQGYAGQSRWLEVEIELQGDLLVVLGSQPQGSHSLPAPPDGSGTAPPLMLVARGSWGSCLPVNVAAVEARAAGRRAGAWTVKVRFSQLLTTIHMPFWQLCHVAAAHHVLAARVTFMPQSLLHASCIPHALLPCRPWWT